MRYVLIGFIVFVFATFFCYAANSSEFPREARIGFFCLAPAAISDVADALEISDEAAMEVAAEYGAMQMCAFGPQGVNVLATKRVRVFQLADGQIRAIYEAFLPTGRTIWFVGPMIGDET